MRKINMLISTSEADFSELISPYENMSLETLIGLAKQLGDITIDVNKTKTEASLTMRFDSDVVWIKERKDLSTKETLITVLRRAHKIKNIYKHLSDEL